MKAMYLRRVNGNGVNGGDSRRDGSRDSVFGDGDKDLHVEAAAKRQRRLWR